MRLGKKEGFVGKGVKILEVIINHDIRTDDGLPAAKYHLLPLDEGEMLIKPGLLF